MWPDAAVASPESCAGKMLRRSGRGLPCPCMRPGAAASPMRACGIGADRRMPVEQCIRLRNGTIRRMPPRYPPRKSLPRRLLRWSGIMLVTWLVVSILLVLSLRFIPPPTSAFMMGRRIDAMLDGERGFELAYRWTPITRVSSNLPIALVAAEDQKFPTHHGFDVEAIQTALADAEDGSRLRGASTISQQVAKNLFLWNGRSFVRKGFEVYFTVLIETLWPKQRIIEVYLNIAEFGDGVYGVGAASERFFRTSPAQLNPHQCALLAAVLPNPRKFHVDRPSSYVQRRSNWIERQVRQLGGPAWLQP
jgi:monofunctional glycosyltransferase